MERFPNKIIITDGLNSDDFIVRYGLELFRELNEIPICMEILSYKINIYGRMWIKENNLILYVKPPEIEIFYNNSSYIGRQYGESMTASESYFVEKICIADPGITIEKVVIRLKEILRYATEDKRGYLRILLERNWAIPIASPLS